MKYPSFVEETTATTGTGDVTPAGATAGHRSLAAAVTAGHMANNDYVPYYLSNTTNWEEGIGRWTGTVFERSIVLANSAGTTSAVSLAGTSTLRVGPMPPMGIYDRGCTLTEYGSNIADGASYTCLWNIGASGFDTDSCLAVAGDDDIYVPDWCDLFQFSFYVNGQPNAGTPSGPITLLADIRGTTHQHNIWSCTVEHYYDGVEYWVDHTLTTPIFKRGTTTPYLNSLEIYNSSGQEFDMGSGRANLRLIG